MSTQLDSDPNSKFVLYSDDYNYYVKDFKNGQISFTDKIQEAFTFENNKIPQNICILPYLTKIEINKWQQ